MPKVNFTGSNPPKEEDEQVQCNKCENVELRHLEDHGIDGWGWSACSNCGSHTGCPVNPRQFRPKFYFTLEQILSVATDEQKKVIKNMQLGDQHLFLMNHNVYHKSLSPSIENIDYTLQIMVNSVESDTSQLSHEHVEYAQKKGWLWDTNIVEENPNMTEYACGCKKPGPSIYVDDNCPECHIYNWTKRNPENDSHGWIYYELERGDEKADIMTDGCAIIFDVDGYTREVLSPIQDKGYSPDSMLNYLISEGWNLTYQAEPNDDENKEFVFGIGYVNKNPCYSHTPYVGGSIDDDGVEYDSDWVLIVIPSPFIGDKSKAQWYVAWKNKSYIINGFQTKNEAILFAKKYAKLKKVKYEIEENPKEVNNPYKLKNHDDVLKDIRSMSSGTIASMTGFDKYTDIDKILSEWLNWEIKHNNSNWAKSWNAFVKANGKPSNWVENPNHPREYLGAIGEEDTAIERYDRMFDNADTEEEKESIAHILNEEKDHKRELKETFQSIYDRNHWINRELQNPNLNKWQPIAYKGNDTIILSDNKFYIMDMKNKGYGEEISKDVAKQLIKNESYIPLLVEGALNILLSDKFHYNVGDSVTLKTGQNVKISFVKYIDNIFYYVVSKGFGKGEFEVSENDIQNWQQNPQSQIISNIMDQIDWRELRMMKMQFISSGDDLILSKGKKSIKIHYNSGVDTYSIEKASLRGRDISNIKRETVDNVYAEDLKPIISEFFKFEYVMRGILRPNPDLESQLIERLDKYYNTADDSLDQMLLDLRYHLGLSSGITYKDWTIAQKIWEPSEISGQNIEGANILRQRAFTLYKYDSIYLLVVGKMGNTTVFAIGKHDDIESWVSYNMWQHNPSKLSKEQKFNVYLAKFILSSGSGHVKNAKYYQRKLKMLFPKTWEQKALEFGNLNRPEEREMIYQKARNLLDSTGIEDLIRLSNPLNNSFFIQDKKAVDKFIENNYLLTDDEKMIVNRWIEKYTPKNVAHRAIEAESLPMKRENGKLLHKSEIYMAISNNRDLRPELYQTSNPKSKDEILKLMKIESDYFWDLSNRIEKYVKSGWIKMAKENYYKMFTIYKTYTAYFNTLKTDEISPYEDSNFNKMISESGRIRGLIWKNWQHVKNPREKGTRKIKCACGKSHFLGPKEEVTCPCGKKVVNDIFDKPKPEAVPTKETVVDGEIRKVPIEPQLPQVVYKRPEPERINIDTEIAQIEEFLKASESADLLNVEKLKKFSFNDLSIYVNEIIESAVGTDIPKNKYKELNHYLLNKILTLTSGRKMFNPFKKAKYRHYRQLPPKRFESDTFSTVPISHTKVPSKFEGVEGKAVVGKLKKGFGGKWKTQSVLIPMMENPHQTYCGICDGCGILEDENDKRCIHCDGTGECRDPYCQCKLENPKKK